MTSFLSPLLADLNDSAAKFTADLAKFTADAEASLELAKQNILREFEALTLVTTVASSKGAKTTLKAPHAEPAKGGKRSPAELVVLTNILLKYIAKHPGQRIEHIAVGLGRPTKELNLPIKKLISEKLIATKGQKRATTYTARG